MVARFVALALAVMPGLAMTDPMVLAAASTNRALDAAIARSGIATVTSYGASGTLARQIEQGAPADLFVSANPAWMEHLVTAGIVQEDSVAVLMSNRLVLIAPEGAGPLKPETIDDYLGDEAFVMADPATAPVGAYGKSALDALGLWDSVAPRFVPMHNTLAAVAAVARGEAALGLVYASDAEGQAISVVWDVPQDSHPPIRYLVAPLSQGDDAPGGKALVEFFLTEGRVEFEAHGFQAVSGGS